MSLWIERIGCCKIVIKTPKYKQVNSLREKGEKKWQEFIKIMRYRLAIPH
jgi:hypothetical protein